MQLGQKDTSSSRSAQADKGRTTTSVLSLLLLRLLLGAKRSFHKRIRQAVTSKLHRSSSSSLIAWLMISNLCLQSFLDLRCLISRRRRAHTRVYTKRHRGRQRDARIAAGFWWAAGATKLYLFPSLLPLLHVARVCCCLPCTSPLLALPFFSSSTALPPRQRPPDRAASTSGSQQRRGRGGAPRGPRGRTVPRGEVAGLAYCVGASARGLLGFPKFSVHSERLE
jgi:hypothetical protein